MPDESRGGATGRCPLCAGAVYGWISVPAGPTEASVGLPLRADADRERVLDRCESCGVALERDVEIDLSAELVAISRPRPDGSSALECPNRASIQAAIGGEGWSALSLAPRRLLLSPRSLELLAERNGRAIEGITFPPLGPNQAWMWQTLVNGLTFHPNFAREVRAGRLRPANARSRLAFVVDSVVTVLAAPLVALVSVPLELAAALARRGGVMTAVLTVRDREA
jgi:hypothetical protein